MFRLIRSFLHHLRNRSYYVPAEKYIDNIKKNERYLKLSKSSYKNNFLNNLVEKGYCNEVSFFSEELDKKIFSVIPQNEISSEGFNLFELPEELKNNVIDELNLNIKEDLIKYLEDEPFFYRIQLKQTITGRSAPSVSSFWHYDIVGKRLKFFYFLDSSLSKINTHLIEKTHNFTKPSNYIISRLYSYYFLIKSLFSKKIKTINPIKGTYFIFDTNIFHKGGFVSREKSYRWTLQCDIISKNKYKKISDIGDKVGL